MAKYHVEYSLFDREVGYYTEDVVVEAWTKVEAVEKFMKEFAPSYMQDIESVKSEDEIDEEEKLVMLDDEDRELLHTAVKNNIAILTDALNRPICADKDFKKTVQENINRLISLCWRLRLEERK